MIVFRENSRCPSVNIAAWISSESQARVHVSYGANCSSKSEYTFGIYVDDLQDN